MSIYKESTSENKYKATFYVMTAAMLEYRLQSNKSPQDLLFVNLVLFLSTTFAESLVYRGVKPPTSAISVVRAEVFKYALLERR